ncbi:Nuclear translocator,Myc-type, basic helix-loop-helix (bHLH) domain,PAS fold,PAS domain [Cinara cedri]|uniref:Nuclear translocator,Myc-type, basic helix-loop-helix (BHLH) domain,PAS fold,PAS domain n=1 Tax=Cinara cedri TaxID=506608 RepID=A0A5E4NK78_9HEMI|nr:Nuclear translocator,Myc-type, basic helix-loop-helix (bHLH) domain,PAS fold,PAS domain [Cinara cedri]
MKPKKRHCSRSSLCNMQSSSRLSASTTELNMDVIGDEHLKNKRKGSAQGSDFEDDNNEESKSARNDDNKKHNHSEIEKRRRDKMNTYITELASMIPMCHNMSRKLDKLTVLRMAVQHMKSIRGTVNSYTEGHYKPPFLSDQDLNKLITQAAEGFVFAVSCDHGKILYISKSVTQVLNYLPEDLIGNSVFDYIHPKDVAKVKEQLSCSDFGSRDRYIDAKTMLPVCEDMINTLPKMCSGARRSFFCRMKCKIYSVKEEADTTTGSKYTQSDKRYSVIQCTGYLKPWVQMNDCDDLSGKNLEQGDNNDGIGADSDSPTNISCLVAVGRIINNSASSSLQSDIVKPPCFTSKHTIDGKFLSVDQRVTYIVGFLPQELLGTSMYEYFHQDDISRLVDIHKATLQECKPKDTETYKFRAKDKTYVHLRSEWKSFRNPWTKDIEFIVAKNILTRSDSKPDSSNKSECSSQNQSQNHHDVVMEQAFSRRNQQLGNKEMQNLITSHLEASKIGRHIVDTVLDEKKKSCDTSSPSFNQHSIKTETFNNNHELSCLRSPFEMLNVPGTSSSHNSGSSYATMIQDNSGSVNVNQLSSTNTNSSVSNNDPNNTPSPLIYSNTGLTISGDSDDLLGDIMVPSSQQLSGTDPNDEAAMAVIMSLLEADAGLGGPVDFSGLPWPLP